MFALLCFLASSASLIVLHTAALAPFILFAAMLIPIPVPQISIPLFSVFFVTFFATLKAIFG